MSIDSIGQDASVAWAITEDGRRFAGELLIGADGYRSVVRRAVAPERPDARFAGYVIWIGIAREADLDHPSPWPTRFVYDEANGYILLGSPLPAEDGSMRPGERRLGWAMYDAGRNDLLRRLGAVKGNVVHHTLLSHEIPKETFEGFGRSTQFWREPWRSAMRDCVKRRAVIGTPIAEYLPDTLINGRLCLVGDAAHVPTPMTANGFSSSLDDALSLGAALAQGVEPDQALRSYEADRLPIVRRIVQSGQDFSRRYAAGRV
ncbi:FAD-dependent monooxygenase [Agrobacterium pusense]|uniref:FAD-dependent monooxygenase n=1 Tax=Agrobacterium pusense TaxID=648995 RepID=UPI0031F34DAE